MPCMWSLRPPLRRQIESISPFTRMNHEKKTDAQHNSLLDETWFAFAMLALIAAIVCGLWWNVPRWAGTGLKAATDAGTFGDSFGSVNALFTGLAFSGVVFSLLLQQRQIRLQRQDFLSQLEEMRGSKETLQTQNILLTVQNQLMRGQTDISILEIEVQAMQLEAQIDELELNRMGAESGGRPTHKLNGMRARTDNLRQKLGALEAHIITTDRAAG